jgi:hypothetical protein
VNLASAEHCSSGSGTIVFYTNKTPTIFVLNSKPAAHKPSLAEPEPSSGRVLQCNEQCTIEIRVALHSGNEVQGAVHST